MRKGHASILYRNESGALYPPLAENLYYIEWRILSFLSSALLLLLSFSLSLYDISCVSRTMSEKPSIVKDLLECLDEPVAQTREPRTNYPNSGISLSFYLSIDSLYQNANCCAFSLRFARGWYRFSRLTARSAVNGKRIARFYISGMRRLRIKLCALISISRSAEAFILSCFLLSLPFSLSLFFSLCLCTRSSLACFNDIVTQNITLLSLAWKL